MNFNSVFEELNKLYEDKESLTEATIYTTKAKMAQLDKAVEDAQKEVAKYKIPMKRNSAGESEPDFEAVPENQREAAKAAHDKYQKALAARPSRSQNIIKYTDEMDESLTEMLPREPVVYDNNGRRILPKDPAVLAVWAKVIDQAEAEGVTFWDDYETQKGLIDRSLTPDEKKLLKNVEFEDGSIRTAYSESLNEAAEDEEIEFAEEPVAPIEEPAEEVEPRQLILECSKCGAIVIKDEADVVVDEESDLVNVEDECEYCEEKEGYKIIGVVAPYEVAEEVANEEPVDEEPVEESLAENYEDDLGRKAWSKNAMSYFDQAAKELGLENFTMKAVSRDINKAGSKDTAIITATKDGKKLEAEDTVEDTNPRNVAEAKEILEFVFGI
jgi:hypothetical protein